jgi:hypothetical protein
MSRRRNEDGSVISAAPPLLVTGFHRSGSTWVGRVLGTAPEAFYIHEPTNPNFAPHYLRLDDIPYYWQIPQSEQTAMEAEFARLLSGQFPRIDARFLRPERRFISRFPQAFSFRWAAFRQKRFLIKDPFMLFNVEWFEQHFSGRVVLVNREPLGFVASLKAKGWTFDFRNWTSQPELMAGPLAENREAIEAAAAHPPDLIEQGCLLWRVLTAETRRLVKANAGRVLISHELLCRDPASEYQRLFDQLGLTWTAKTERMLRLRRRASFDKESTNITRSVSDFDALWLDRLDKKEIGRIRELTES